jgi:hypothetical protein
VLDERVMNVALGLMGLLVVIVTLCATSLAANSVVPGRGGPSSRLMVRYFRSGQLVADVRTACSMVQFLLEPDVTTLNAFPLALLFSTASARLS